MKLRLPTLLVASLATSAVLAQSATTGFPDLNPSGGAGCNAIPFSTYFGAMPGSWTELTVLPAAMLQAKGVPAGSSPTSLAFAPCGSGVLHFPQIRIIVGHLSSTSSPASFSSVFADTTSIMDNAMSGPIDWNCTGSAWSPLWTGATSFVWDGTRSVGVLISVAGTTCSTTTAWTGTFMRENTLSRSYASGFGAFAPTTSSINALKSRWTWSTPPMAGSVLAYGNGVSGLNGTPTLDAIGQPLIGNPTFAVHLASAYAGVPSVLAISHTPGYVEIGVPGSSFPLLVDPTPGMWLGALPSVVSASGHSIWSLPIPTSSALVGASFALQAIVFDPSGVPTVVGPATASPGLLVTVGG